MPRINVVERAAAEHECERCGDTIPKGSGYRWIKPRYGRKKTRCMKAGCAFRPTDLSSSKTARIEEAIEDARTAVEEATCAEDIQQALTDLAEIAREVADEYQEASDSFGSQGNEEFQEKADTCGQFADELEGWSPSGEEDEDAVREEAAKDCERGEDEDEEAYKERLQQEQDEAWEARLQEMRDEADEALDEWGGV